MKTKLNAGNLLGVFSRCFLVGFLTCFIAIECEAKIDASNLVVFDLVFTVTQGLEPLGGGSIYEISKDWNVPVAGFGRGNEILIKGNGYRALIEPRRQFAEHSSIPCGYYRYVGLSNYSENKISNDVRLHKFVELSARDTESVRQALEEQAERLEQEKFEARRRRAIDDALAEIKELTADDAVINRAYEQTQKIYDEAYRINGSEKDAEAAAKEMGGRLIKVLKDDAEKERQRREKERLEWERTHPEEAAEERRIEEERLARVAKEKLDGEIMRTKETVKRVKESVESLKRRGKSNQIPKDLKSLKLLIGTRLPPMIDAWNGKIEYIASKRGYRIVSPGPDGKVGTTDDIEMAGEGELEKGAVDLSTVVDCVEAIEKYEGEVVPSICGFKFGQKAVRKRGSYVMEEVKPLLRPFRCCSEAILRYAGDIDPRLVDVVLVGRVPEKNGGSARVVQEGPICASLIEKKFEIKLHTSPVGEYIVGSYLRNNVFGIELRNDGTDVIDGEEYAVLTIEWRDLFLEALIAKRDADVKAATTRRDDPNELEKVPMPVVEQPVASDLDAL